MHKKINVELKKLAFIGNYLPRKCGIATFTTDLSKAFAEKFPDIETMVLAMNDDESGYDYPETVRYELYQDKLLDYERAASFLNQHAVDVINLQHEYGIFGGENGKYVLRLLRRVNAPVVATLHTILENPDPDQHWVLQEITQLSSRLVVMSQRSVNLLRDIYDVPEEKIDLIPHGIHDVPFVDSGFQKDKFGVEGKTVLLTFGLLSRNKGVEYVLDALPEVVKRHPNLHYIILGATHPHIVLQEGEQYREMLQEQVRRLGLENNVSFHDQFVSIEELKEYISVADIYLTPYLEREQIVSGTLAYTVGAGKAVVSTPYHYAEELLSDGRGIIVPFKDSKAITEKLLYLLENEAKRDSMRKLAYLHGRNMIWPAVAESYKETFEQARREVAAESYSSVIAGFSDEYLTKIPPLNLNHMKNMTDGTGMLQHAVFSVPNYDEGYTTDDNARALIVTMLLEKTGIQLEADREKSGSARVHALAQRYFAFLWHAFDVEKGRFRNFMSYDRQWLEEVGSEDSHGRSLWALGTVMDSTKNVGLRGMAGRLFDAAIRTTVNFTAPRAWAFTLIGINYYSKSYPGDRAICQVQDTLAEKLVKLYRSNSTPDWPWFEDIATYCNPALSQALLQYGKANNSDEAIEIGLESLTWLAQIQQPGTGFTIPIGCHGFYPKGDEMALYDQQPVEVYSLFSACLEAYEVTKDAIWYARATNAFDWFLGRNALRLPLYDEQTGGCRDGLHIDRLNENQGAESTLSYLQSWLEMYQVRKENSALYWRDEKKMLARSSVQSSR